MENLLMAKLLRVGEVAALVGVSKSTIWRWCSEGLFPRPIKMGKTTRWDSNDVLGFIEGQKGTH